MIESEVIENGAGHALKIEPPVNARRPVPGVALKEGVRPLAFQLAIDHDGQFKLLGRWV